MLEGGYLSYHLLLSLLHCLFIHFFGAILRTLGKPPSWLLHINALHTNVHVHVYSSVQLPIPTDVRSKVNRSFGLGSWLQSPICRPASRLRTCMSRAVGLVIAAFQFRRCEKFCKFHGDKCFPWAFLNHPAHSYASRLQAHRPPHFVDSAEHEAYLIFPLCLAALSRVGGRHIGGTAPESRKSVQQLEIERYSNLQKQCMT